MTKITNILKLQNYVYENNGLQYTGFSIKTDSEKEILCLMEIHNHREWSKYPVKTFMEINNTIINFENEDDIDLLDSMIGSTILKTVSTKASEEDVNKLDIFMIASEVMKIILYTDKGNIIFYLENWGNFNHYIIQM